MEEGMLYSIIPDKEEIHPSLAAYCELPEIERAAFDKDSEKHTYVTKDGCERTCKGVRSFIHTRHLCQEYVQPRRPRGKKINYKKKSATAEIGLRVGRFIEAFVYRGGVKPIPVPARASDIKKRVYRFAMAIIEWLEQQGYKVQAAELPVVFENLSRMTRADLITKDRTGKHLVVWEIKCGFPAGFDRHKKKMKAPLEKHSCTEFNKWALQAMYTEAGLKKRGLDSVCVKILHAWEEEVEEESYRKSPGKRKRGDTAPELTYKVAARSLPEWVKRYQDQIMDRL